MEHIGENVFASPMQKTSLVNEKVIIDIQEGNDEINTYTFSGIITDVQVELDRGDHGFLHIYAASPTIELERGKMLQTFSDTDLSRIVDEVATDAHFKIVKDPKHTADLKFSMQYKETDFQYLRRLARMYGEMLHYSGEALMFGKYTPRPAVKVTYGHDLIEVKLGTKLIANTFSQYYHTADFEKSPYEHPLSKPGTFAGDANAQATRMNLLRKPDMPVDVPVWDEGGLQELTGMRKERNYTDMFHVTGRTNVYRVRIGGMLEIDFHGKMLVEDRPGTLRVIRVKHVFDANERYYNEFDAVPAEFDRIPCPDMDFPVASALPAKVVANEDPDGLGKVQVKFDFDKRDCDYWLPVMMPEAGGPQNRGYIFVPEVNDKVLISFFDGNPEFPFVMGSMFHGKNGKGIGGGAGNHIKSMRDKSGSEVVLNTQDGSAAIKDKNGSDSKIKLDGSKNITIDADTSITINIGKGQCIFKIDKEGVATVDTKNMFKVTVGGSTLTMTPNDVSIKTKSTMIEAGTNSISGTNHITGGDTKIDGGNVFVN
ncbi:MAG: phage baseplate assembly protein V [Dysgonamonadaceae bacterium]|nr:phage baseplate assembly protein V [Dysgonamonadaceae bacterium]